MALTTLKAFTTFFNADGPHKKPLREFTKEIARLTFDEKEQMAALICKAVGEDHTPTDPSKKAETDARAAAALAEPL